MIKMYIPCPPKLTVLLGVCGTTTGAGGGGFGTAAAAAAVAAVIAAWLLWRCACAARWLLLAPFDVDDILQLTLTTPLLDLPKLPSMELLEEVEEDEEDVEEADELDTVAVFTPTSMPP